MKQLYIGLLLGIGCMVGVQAQTLKQFSEDRGEFTTQLGTYMTASKQKAQEELYQEFAKSFRGGVFSEEEFQQVLKTGNAMLQYRMTANPYFNEYLQSLLIVKKTGNPEQNFKEWHRMLDAMLADIENQKINPFLEFLQFSRGFFENGKLRSSDLGTNWYALSDKFEWRYANKKPSVYFAKLDLMAGHKQDSIYLYGTSGEYFPVEQKWKGKGGKVTWERLGLTDVYAEVDDYELETKMSLYEVKNARLHYPQFFGNKMVAGTLSDKLIFSNDASSGSYPRFVSAENKLNLENIGKGIKFVGGFRLQGTTVYGIGTKDDKAKISVEDGRKQAIFRGASESFVIRKGEQIIGERVETVLYFGKDSIYHPSVNIRFNIDKGEIQLSRGERGSDRNPFYSSVHKMNLDAEDIQVNLNGDSILIGKKTIASSFKQDVSFESLQYFNKSEYQRIQNVGSSNPLAIIKVTAERKKTRLIEADTLARRINAKFTVDNIQTLLYDLVAKGFINYDSDKQMVEVKDKVFLYADADQKKVDYDLIKIKSATDSTNAVLNLKDHSMNIRGINALEFSSRQRVGLKPNQSQLRMKANRDMDFDGRLFAGLTLLEGKDFHFNYDKFQIGLDSVRYFDLFVPTDTMDKNGQPVARAIKSRIEYLNGVLLIDAPNNKSGQEDIPIFPSLQTKKPSFVYYDVDRDTASEGTYGRDSFYFKVDPFSFNHLDRYTKEDIAFKGTLRSADIFPDIKETLKLQDDSSLGFITETPKEGLPTYKSKGNYTGKLNLSNRGMQGEGKLKYLGASVDAKAISFKPKDLQAKADQFNLEEDRASGVQVPRVRGVDVSINWRPYQDSMYVRSETAPFKLFNKENHTLAGTLILTPGGLKGDGLLDWDKASMTSELFSFGAYSAKADTTDLKIKAAGAADLALKTSNVKGEVDFDQEVGNFKANDEFLITTLPYNQYETSMNEFKWDMKEEIITFKADANKLGKFLSIHPDQDSLKFEGKNAAYYLKSSELKIGGVPYIVAADAYIYPDSGRVDIQSGGLMTQLDSARIVCDTVNKNHVINRATVQIQGRRFYRASGFYEYNIGNRKQEIEFQDIIGQPVGKGSYKAKAAVTRAKGDVKPEADFYIDHKTRFYGTINLSAESKNLQFDGFARLESEKLPQRNWFTIVSEGDKKDLAIRYNEPKTEEGDPAETGLFLSKESARVYPRVMMPLHFRKDRAIFPAKGVFKYYENKDYFVFGDSAKVLTNSMKGNQLTLKNLDASVEADGKFNLGSGLKYVKLDAAGFMKTIFAPAPDTTANQMVSDTATLETLDSNAVQEPEMPVTGELMLATQFTLPEALLKVLFNDIQASFDAPTVNYLTDINFYKKAATEIFPDNDEVQTSIIGMSSGFLDIPKKYNPYTFVFSRAKMKWNVEYQSFVSTDPKIGITSINGEPVHKTLTCYIECRMPSNDDDRLYIYIKTPSDMYYFFGYKQGILSVTSSNPQFTEALAGMKAKDLVFKMPDGETFEIQAVETSDAQLFLRRIQAVAK